jgi:hypothetical protein
VDKFGIGLSLEDTDGKRYEASTDFTEGTVKTSDKKSITYERNFRKDEYTFFDNSGDKPFSFSTEYIDGNDDVAEDAREIAGIVFNKGGYDPGALSEALDAHYNPTPDEDGSITYPSITSAYEEILEDRNEQLLQYSAMHVGRHMDFADIDERKKEEINELIAPFMNPERATEDNSRVADRFPADFDAALSAAEDKANVDNESLMSDADTKNEPEEVK